MRSESSSRAETPPSGAPPSPAATRRAPWAMIDSRRAFSFAAMSAAFAESRSTREMFLTADRLGNQGPGQPPDNDGATSWRSLAADLGTAAAFTSPESAPILPAFRRVDFVIVHVYLHDISCLCTIRA